MKTGAAAARVGITALIAAIIAYGSFKFVGKGLPSQSGYEVWALFRDATGLVEKSRVQIAGLVIGEIGDRTLQGNLARITVRVKPDVKLWSNSAIYKRTASLLGEFYLEIDPGTAESPDPLTGKARANYPLEGCVERTKDPTCNQIRNVVEAVTTTDVLVQVNETLPVLRDILRDVQELTAGPIRNITHEVEVGINKNSDAMAKLLEHIDRIVQDVEKVTTENGPVYRDLRSSMDNVRQVTESLKSLVGTGEGQVNTAGDKIKRDLDQLSVTLEKMNKAIDQVADVTERVNRGEGTVGKLLKDSSIADNITDVSEDAAGFVRSITRLQTHIGLSEEYGFYANAFKTYVQLRLQPRPDKYYSIELVDDPRGSRSWSHQVQSTRVGDGTPQVVNIDTYNRSSAFRFSFQFAKRVEGKGVGLTGRLGIKESTGGGGVDVDLWKQRIVLSADMFDFASEKYPRLKVMAAVELFKHVWVLGGVDDAINKLTDTAGPTGSNNMPLAKCGDAGSPLGWCQGGLDYFVGARLTFNDEDLRALLTIGGGALGGAAR